MKPPAIGDAYRAALESLLAGGGESALNGAYELGRRAVAEGLGVLDVISMHHRAVAEMRHKRSRHRDDQCEAFLLECLAPFEMVHRGVLESNAALHRINDALENEVQRIAHALHDEAGQILVSVHLALQQLAREPPADLAARVADVRRLLDDVEAQIRRLSHELRPTVLDHLGLLPALRFLAEGFSGRTGIHIEVEGELEERLPPSIETPLYRVAQEALHNVFRHAQARSATLSLAIEGRKVRCTIKDDGRGFQTTSSAGGGGLGLVGIRERLRPIGGNLEIRSAPRRGTELEITIPLEGPNSWQSGS